MVVLGHYLRHESGVALEQLYLHNDHRSFPVAQADGEAVARQDWSELRAGASALPQAVRPVFLQRNYTAVTYLEVVTRNNFL
jgi:stage V sporulation protein SpoVS